MGPDKNPSEHGALYWDGVAGQAEKKPHYLDTFLGEMKRRAHLALVEQWGGELSAGRVLKTDLFEEAFGPDALLADLAGKGAIAVGMDVSWEIAAGARRRSPGNAFFLAADVRNLPFKGGSFDFILSPSTLDHFSDPADLGRSLKELACVLKTDGRLIVTLDNRQNIFDPLLRLVGRLGLVPYYLGLSYHMRELIDELKASGLKASETTAILHNPRLVAIAMVAVANRIGWRPLIRLVQKSLIAAQRFEKTRWRFYTGSFIAAKAIRKNPVPVRLKPREPSSIIPKSLKNERHAKSK
jgi:SAM-dependent methyltransferase